MRTYVLANFSGYDEFVITPPTGYYIVCSEFKASTAGGSNWLGDIGVKIKLIPMLPLQLIQIGGMVFGLGSLVARMLHHISQMSLQHKSN